MNFNYWRYIPPLATSGAVQMAIDLWLLEEYRHGRQPPILRFYTWSPAAISLGYYQREYPPLWQEIKWQGKPLEIVRRPTGGRAVLHQGDLSYMVVTSTNTHTRWQMYQYLCEFLIQGWRSLGVELRYGKAGKGYIHNPSCFSTATSADLVTLEGDKLIGSAQLRQGKVLLQHGSMILNANSSLYSQVFDAKAPKSVKITLNQVIESLKEAASSYFQIKLMIKPLSSEEWEKIFSHLEKCKLVKSY